MQQRQDQAARRPKNHASASVWVPGDFCTQKLLLMQLLYLALYSCTLISFAFAKVVTSTLTPGISHDGEALPFADSVARYALLSPFATALRQTRAE